VEQSVGVDRRGLRPVRLPSRPGLAACPPEPRDAPGDDEEKQEPRPVALEGEGARDAQQQDEDVRPLAGFSRVGQVVGVDQRRLRSAVAHPFLQGAHRHVAGRSHVRSEGVAEVVEAHEPDAGAKAENDALRWRSPADGHQGPSSAGEMSLTDSCTWVP
jgi:hypothetical protein